ncbi:hypothetical protein BKA65DRAFT_582370 [Rhexocercosporidium sp. MPI-PUGE-AT-0058]|nr:hypothetical protein BKA65DRAFT_582370 [Rhexocercosporidium sp. MPI-PUGE-AT-0058]
MAQERVQVLRDLSDIARVANGPQPPPLIPPPELETFATPEAEPIDQGYTPTPTGKTKALTNRDANAIEYTKSQLNEGDTLVIVRFPNNQPVYDATGFRLSDTHRVHSDRLKSASPLFKKALEDDWQQHRFKRRNRLLGSMPDGIQYVLDLTPPEEGDDALELTAELSCSLGIRRWYKSEFSGVSAAHGLVGGEDETTVHPDLRFGTSSPGDVQEIIDTGASSSNETPPRPVIAVDEDVALQRTLAQSKRLFQQNSTQQNDYTRNYNDKVKAKKTEIETLDYCPIRHRTGIERLLQIIEGKDPRLDSAPKVWTLAVLAKHFECANSVVDYVVTWMIAEPNCKIFEILPEDCLRIGLLLQNEVITRYAFTILVSEEAFRVGTARSEPENQPNTNYSAGKQVTKFGRARESLDEDTLNLIQHAGRNFHARIEQEVQYLFSLNMNWLHALPEFGKILKIREFVEANTRLFDPEEQMLVNAAIEELIYYTRGRLLWCFYQPLDHAEQKSWQEHRGQERHERDAPAASTPDTTFNELAEEEKLMTRFFWSTVRLLKWKPSDSRCSTNLIRDQIWPRSAVDLALEAKANRAADANSIPKISMHGLERTTERLNKIILEAIRDVGFNDGQFPREALMVERVIERPAEVREVDTHMADRCLDYEYQRAQKTDYWKPRPDPVLFDSSQSYFKEPLETKSEKPGFWKEALEARDRTIKSGGSSPDASSPSSPDIKKEVPETWGEYFQKGSSSKTSPPQGQRGSLSSWQKVESIFKKEQSSKTSREIPIRPVPDTKPHHNFSWSLDQRATFPVLTSTYDFDASSTPHVPVETDITPSSPFFSLSMLFAQIDLTVQRACNRMLSRGEIENLRPFSCDICDTLLCLGDEEYKYLPLWANGLNDGTGGVFEEAIPPAERGGAMGPGPAYHTGSTANSRASTEIDFDGRSSVFGSMVGSEMEGVNTSVGVEDGWSVDHVDRRRVFSESEFMTPGSSEFEGSVVFVGKGDDMVVDLPIREKGKGKDVGFEDEGVDEMPSYVMDEKEQAVLLASYVGKGKEKEREVDEEMVDVLALSDAQRGAGKTASMDNDDENFFNTADDNTEFEFESDDDDDDGDETETEDDFECIG